MTYAVSIVPHRVLDRLVLAKFREIVGGRFRGTISGGGALQPHVDEFFNFIGIPVLEGYGMTETSPVSAVRTWDKLVIGTVGPPFPSTQIRIFDLVDGKLLYPNPKLRHGGLGLRGEIHVSGPQVMRGYYENPQRTAEVLTADGWFNSGDLGHVDERGVVWITGRAKDTIVLAGGENVEPEPVETLIKTCLLYTSDAADE